MGVGRERFENSLPCHPLVHKTTEAGFRAPCDCASVPTTSMSILDQSKAEHLFTFIREASYELHS